MVSVRAPPCTRAGVLKSRKRTQRVHLVGVARRGKVGATNVDAPPTTASTSADLRTICKHTGHQRPAADAAADQSHTLAAVRDTP